ncbi:Ppt1 [Drosophila busckii]|uniref:Palmitoyl-protein thioesterase 1 n=1 Tax=Drosophila busckii TaxID=30019 RepID=A0A0M4ERF4_DROBS|nr:palmitoyl-protein thioesterase 1 [Drosophila busckii]ALC48702.1 Ppt1 [Drosophila busckii]
MRLLSYTLFLVYCCMHFAQAAAAAAPASADNKSVLPVVLWHGMGDTCCFKFSLGSIKKLIEEQTNGTYVRSLKIGANVVLDYESGFFIHPNKQVDFVCKLLADDVRLSNGYNAIGFSQGGQFLRAVAQRCPNPPMRTLISLGGQHQGVYGLPKCPTLSVSSCEYISQLLNHAAYESWVQNDLVQATYWHDPLHESNYKLKSSFLADINNELYINEGYAENLNKLKKLVLVKFLNDTIVQPKESQWFEFYAPGQDTQILPLNQSKVYKNLRLDQLAKHGKLQFLSTEGDHLAISKAWFIENLVPLLLEE